MKWKELGILGLWRKNYLWNSRWWHWTVIHTNKVSVMCLHHVSSPAPSPVSCHSEPGAKLTCWGLLNCSVPPKEALWMDTSWSTLGPQALSFSLIYSWKGDVQLWRVGDFFSGRDRGWGPEVYVAYSSSSSISCSVVSDSHDLMDCSPPGCSVYGIHQSRIPYTSPGDLPHPGIEPESLVLQVNSLPSEPLGKPTGMGMLLSASWIWKSESVSYKLNRM